MKVQDMVRGDEWYERHNRVMQMIRDDHGGYWTTDMDADPCFDCGSQFIAHRCCMEDA